MQTTVLLHTLTFFHVFYTRSRSRSHSLLRTAVERKMKENRTRERLRQMMLDWMVRDGYGILKEKALQRVDWLHIPILWCQLYKWLNLVKIMFEHRSYLAAECQSHKKCIRCLAVRLWRYFQSDIILCSAVYKYGVWLVIVSPRAAVTREVSRLTES